MKVPIKIEPWGVWQVGIPTLGFFIKQQGRKLPGPLQVYSA